MKLARRICKADSDKLFGYMEEYLCNASYHFPEHYLESMESSPAESGRGD